MPRDHAAPSPGAGSTRRQIRSLKRSVQAAARAACSEDERREAMRSAIDLLERSITMGHRRLALIRLRDAVRVGAPVPEPHWRYCLELVHSNRDPALRQLLVTLSASC